MHFSIEIMQHRLPLRTRQGYFSTLYSKIYYYNRACYLNSLRNYCRQYHKAYIQFSSRTVVVSVNNNSLCNAIRAIDLKSYTHSRRINTTRHQGKVARVNFPANLRKIMFIVEMLGKWVSRNWDLSSFTLYFQKASTSSRCQRTLY